MHTPPGTPGQRPTLVVPPEAQRLLAPGRTPAADDASPLLRPLLAAAGTVHAHRWRLRSAAGWLAANWPGVAAWALAAAITAGLFWLLAQLLAVGATSTSSLLDWLRNAPVPRTVTDSIYAYLDAHTGALPATGRDLWIGWLAAGGLLYAAALTGSVYGRTGWAVFGALSAAAAYAGAPAGAGPLTAGITAAAWLVLSLPAYARTTPRPAAVRYDADARD